MCSLSLDKNVNIEKIENGKRNLVKHLKKRDTRERKAIEEELTTCLFRECLEGRRGGSDRGGSRGGEGSGGDGGIGGSHC